MDFSEALIKLKEKEVVARDNIYWTRIEKFVYVPIIRCFCSSFNLYCNCGIYNTIYYRTCYESKANWSPSTDDLFADDWIILEPREKYLPTRKDMTDGLEANKNT